MISLYTYWRSTAAYRVRVALNLKNLEYNAIPVHLVRQGGEQHMPEFRQLNPQGLVPVMTAGDVVLNQSVAIMEYLQEVHPEPAILPQDAVARARCRSLTQMVVSDIHPLNNLRVLQYLKKDWSEEQVNQWYHHWIQAGFEAIEQMLQHRNTEYMSAEHPCMDDICLLGQIYNARRFQVPLKEFPEILQIEQACQALEAFQQAHPEQQPDAE